MTGMYTVLNKFRAKVQLTNAGKIRFMTGGLIPKLDKIHNNIDIAVAKVYGWSNTLSDDEIISNIIELNENRANDEIHR